MSLGCFVEKRRFLQLPLKKTSWLAPFFAVDLQIWEDSRINFQYEYYMTNIIARKGRELLGGMRRGIVSRGNSDEQY